MWQVEVQLKPDGGDLVRRECESGEMKPLLGNEVASRRGCRLVSLGECRRQKLE